MPDQKEAAEKSESKCPVCGNERIKEHHNYCGVCGSQLKESPVIVNFREKRDEGISEQTLEQRVSALEKEIAELKEQVSVRPDREKDLTRVIELMNEFSLLVSEKLKEHNEILCKIIRS